MNNYFKAEVLTLLFLMTVAATAILMLLVLFGVKTSFIYVLAPFLVASVIATIVGMVDIILSWRD